MPIMKFLRKGVMKVF